MIRGYEVIVGDEKGGIFNLSRSKIKAIKWGEAMLRSMKPYIKKDAKVIVKRVMLKKCDLCKNLTYSKDKYCLTCENIINEQNE